jgi:uncharacterized protein YaeQ
MALKSTIFKAQLQIADMDRQLYADHSLTLAQHPSETDERLMMRVLAFALHVPADDHDGALEFGKGLSDTDEPDLWRRNLTGEIEHWIDLGQPDDRRLIRAAGRSKRVTVLGYHASLPIWWKGIAGKVARLSNLDVWAVDPEQSQALAGIVQRTMQLQVTVQDGLVWIADSQHSIELAPRRLSTDQGV